MKLPEIPKTWLVAAFLLSMVVLRTFGVDSFATGGIGLISGYLFGAHINGVVKKG
jgi:hypothetical protein